MNEEFGKKYKRLTSFIAAACDPEMHFLAMLINNEITNEYILQAIGKKEAELVIAEAKDDDFIPALKLELGYEEKSEEEKANFHENVDEVIDYLRSVDLGTIEFE